MQIKTPTAAISRECRSQVSHQPRKEKVMIKATFLIMAAGSMALLAGPAMAGAGIITGPYTADSNTLHLYHFDETSGDYNDTGNGTELDLTVVGGTQGETGYSGFGNAYDLGTTSSTNRAQYGGGTGADVNVDDDFQSTTTNQFTMEALIRPSSLPTSSDNTHQIITLDDKDKPSDDDRRAAQFRLRHRDGTVRLSFIALELDRSNPYIEAPIPTSGTHGFVADAWYHVAVTYDADGDETDTGYAKLYWTKLAALPNEANELTNTIVYNGYGTDQKQLTDMDASATQFYVGNRESSSTNLRGRVDEVRVSDTVRGPDEFIFAVPEPATLALLALGGLAFGGSAVRKRCRTV
jgi:hypothetical protein